MTMTHEPPEPADVHSGDYLPRPVDDRLGRICTGWESLPIECTIDSKLFSVSRTVQPMASNPGMALMLRKSSLIFLRLSSNWSHGACSPGPGFPGSGTESNAHAPRSGCAIVAQQEALLGSGLLVPVSREFRAIPDRDLQHARGLRSSFGASAGCGHRR